MTKTTTATQRIREIVAKMGEDDETTIKEIVGQAGCTVPRVAEVTRLHVEVPMLVRGSSYGMWKRNMDVEPLTAMSASLARTAAPRRRRSGPRRPTRTSWRSCNSARR